MNNDIVTKQYESTTLFPVSLILGNIVKIFYIF